MLKDTRCSCHSKCGFNYPENWLSQRFSSVTPQHMICSLIILIGRMLVMWNHPHQKFIHPSWTNKVKSNFKWPTGLSYNDAMDWSLVHLLSNDWLHIQKNKCMVTYFLLTNHFIRIMFFFHNIQSVDVYLCNFMEKNWWRNPTCSLQKWSG